MLELVNVSQDDIPISIDELESFRIRVSKPNPEQGPNEYEPKVDLDPSQLP